MKLTILSEDQAIKYSFTTDHATSIVSITCPGEDVVIFGDNSNIVAVFRMQFNDVEHGRYENLKPPVREDFMGLKEFVDKLDCEELVVHCGAGISRSAGTAAAINDYLGLGYQIFGNQKYHPNTLVYKYACEELGIQPIKDERYYQNMFADIEL